MAANVALAPVDARAERSATATKDYRALEVQADTVLVVGMTRVGTRHSASVATACYRQPPTRAWRPSA